MTDDDPWKVKARIDAARERTLREHDALMRAGAEYRNDCPCGDGPRPGHPDGWCSEGYKRRAHLSQREPSRDEVLRRVLGPDVAAQVGMASTPPIDDLAARRHTDGPTLLDLPGDPLFADVWAPYCPECLAASGIPAKQFPPTIEPARCVQCQQDKPRCTMVLYGRQLLWSRDGRPSGAEVKRRRARAALGLPSDVHPDPEVEAGRKPCGTIATTTWCCAYHAEHDDDDFMALFDAALDVSESIVEPELETPPQRRLRAVLARLRPLLTRTPDERTVVRSDDEGTP